MVNYYIVDDRSEDDTGKILDKFAAAHPAFHALHVHEASSSMTPKKHALTQGIRQSRGEWIVSTDADCRVGPRWISSVVHNLEPDVGILVGYSGVMADTLFEKYQALDFAAIMVANAGMMMEGYAWSGSGQNLAYRRDCFTEIGGFQPVADRRSGDDVYLVQNIPRKTRFKAKFVFNPEHFATTRAMTDYAQFLSQRIRWSSNSRGLEKTDPQFFAFLLFAFLSNLLLLTHVLLFPLNDWFWASFIIKFVGEGAVLAAGAKRFNFKRILWVYPLWFIIQPAYISYVGLMGLRGKFKWKE